MKNFISITCPRMDFLVIILPKIFKFLNFNLKFYITAQAGKFIIPLANQRRLL
jgi:hypothetical protein